LLSSIAAHIEKSQPTATPRDVARLCLLLTNHVDDLEQLRDDRRLSDLWREMAIRLQAASDQHAAMAEELDALVRLDVKSFAMEQVGILIRAIKVQNQVLQMYVGRAPQQA
jgi:hypothetical protein